MALPLWLTKLLIRTRLARFSRRARRLTDGGTSFLRYYSDRVLTAPVEEFLDPAYFPDRPGAGVFDLNQSAPCSESGVSLGRFTAERRGNPPANGLPELRVAVAARSYRLDGRKLEAESEILVTHGATSAFTAALDAFVNPGGRVVLFDPSSPLFFLGAK
jgi:DNA-binding transcriptional MocR family regulator